MQENTADGTCHFHFTVNHFFEDYIVSHTFPCISPAPTVNSDINIVMNPKKSSIQKENVSVILSDNTICGGNAGQLEQNADYTVMWDWGIEENSPLTTCKCLILKEK